MKHIIAIILLVLLFSACGSRVRIISLTVEGQDGSMPLATNEPRFSWCYEASVDDVVQTDYRIIVASSEENAKRGIGDLWDSKECLNASMSECLSADASNTQAFKHSNNHTITHSSNQNNDYRHFGRTRLQQNIHRLGRYRRATSQKYA